MLQAAVVSLGVSENCMRACVYGYIRPPQCSRRAEEVTLNLMRTVFFILFVFNFGLLSAFYMGSSLHCV